MNCGNNYKVLSLTDEEFGRGIFTASSGNHALAFTHAMKTAREAGRVSRDVQSTVFVPETTAPSKLESLRLAGAPLQLFGTDVEQAESHARRTAEARVAPGGEVIYAPSCKCVPRDYI